MKRIRLISKSIVALCAIIALSFYVGEAKAQAGMSPQWVLHSQKDGVNIYYQVSRCVPSTANLDPTQNPDPSKLIPTKLLLKFENLDSKSKTISWNSNLTTKSDAMYKTASLAGLSSLVQDCNSASEIVLKSEMNSNNPISLAEVLGQLNFSATNTKPTN